jgi:hypothetical protein
MIINNPILLTLDREDLESIILILHYDVDMMEGKSQERMKEVISYLEEVIQ